MTEALSPQSVIPSIGRASSIDYVENLKRLVPQYFSTRVMVQYAIMSDQRTLVEQSDELLNGYKADNEAGLIKPPLSNDLTREMSVALREEERGWKLPTTFLLAWAMIEDPR